MSRPDTNSPENDQELGANASALSHELSENPELLTKRWEQFVTTHPDAANTLRQIANRLSEGNTKLKERFLQGFVTSMALQEHKEQGRAMESMLEGEATHPQNTEK